VPSYLAKNIYFGSQFGSFQCLVGWPVTFGPVLRQYIMSGARD
jgi:hypothetical protein